MLLRNLLETSKKCWAKWTNQFCQATLRLGYTNMPFCQRFCGPPDIRYNMKWHWQQKKISRYLRRWLGLPRSLSSTALYDVSNTLQFSLGGIVGEFKMARTRQAILYRDSKDPKVAEARIEVQTGRKWKASQELSIAEQRLKHKEGSWTMAGSLIKSWLLPEFQVEQRKIRKTVSPVVVQNFSIIGRSFYIYWNC